MIPSLREELALYPGPRSIDGHPSWSLHDPVRNLFFGIDWLTFEILSRWHMDDAEQILADIAHETTIHPEMADIEAVHKFLIDNELACNHGPNGTKWYCEQAAKRRSTWLNWLLHHYLFFRIPLMRPDRWLGRALPWVAPLASPAFTWMTIAALLAGLIETSRQWETFVATLVDTFSLQGLAGFGAALVFAKFMHELGHAFAAKRQGCRVPTMGVAFLVMFPVAYTDVNEVWKLDDRRKRLAVGIAGIRTELTIAAWATLLWALAPDGAVRGALFLLASTTWITTLAVNASPFMRFDGYFILMDWLGLENLHQRAFALARWKLREVLFALGEEAPEAMPAARAKGLMIFAYAIWVYRLVVFGGIAAFVYHSFPKPLGPALGLVEVLWFILMPVFSEMREWGRRADAIRHSRRALALVGGIGLLLLGTAVPWDSRIRAQGILRPADYAAIIVPQSVRIVAMPVADGAAVKKDDVLFELESPDLEYQRTLKGIQSATLGWQSAAAGVNADLRGKIGMIEANRAQVDAEILGVSAQRNRFVIKAPTDGVVFLADLDNRPGDWQAKNGALAAVANPAAWQVTTYLSEADIQRVAIGGEASFYPEQSATGSIALRVTAIDRDGTRLLAEGMLASTRGGQIATRETRDGAVPDSALYRVTLRTAEPVPLAAPVITRGNLMLYGTSKSLMGDFLRSAAGLLVRETGF